MSDPTPPPDAVRFAEAVRDACVRAALDAFHDASISGLCCTGAWEVAVGAVQTLDPAALAAAASGSPRAEEDATDEPAR